jgi:hypothetical protein
MHIKEIKTSRTSLTAMDLIGSDENALSKVFAYLIGSDRECFLLLSNISELRYKILSPTIMRQKYLFKRIELRVSPILKYYACHTYI